MENNECYGKILKKFDDISEKKKNELEVKLTNNIKHSLKKILEGLS
jgi:adenylyl- and sulfurtransferase ThiI